MMNKKRGKRGFLTVITSIVRGKGIDGRIDAIVGLAILSGWGGLSGFFGLEGEFMIAVRSVRYYTSVDFLK